MVDIPDEDKYTFHVPAGPSTFRVAYDGATCAGRKTEDVPVDLGEKQVRIF